MGPQAKDPFDKTKFCIRAKSAIKITPACIFTPVASLLCLRLLFAFALALRIDTQNLRVNPNSFQSY